MSIGVLGIAISLPVAAQMIEQEGSSTHCDEAKTRAEYEAIVERSPQSSLANYCLGNLLFKQKNYQTSVIAYRSALRGDGYPTWTKVWSHIQIGKIRFNQPA